MPELTGNNISILMEKISARIMVKGEAAARAAGMVLEQQVKLELSTPPDRTGRLYPRGGGKARQASAPGEPPAPDTGALRSSVQTQHLPDGSVEIRVKRPYAVVLEFGAPERGLAARPFFRTAIAKAREPMCRAARAAAKRK